MKKLLSVLAVLAWPGAGVAASPSQSAGSLPFNLGWAWEPALSAGAGGWAPLVLDGGQNLLVDQALPALSAAIAGTTSATPGTWTSVLAANGARRGCTIQDAGTASLDVAMGPGVPGAAAFTLQPGQAFNCIDQQQVWVMSGAGAVSYQGAAW
ncbi:hypothetical protein [Acidocella sp.]|uniref:hypothetical protein n=1 Tax=Acidocella sp. TaxID=50710 RepID=UPI00261D3DA2|nr:hypothetical protein [Acidocella sp.]